MRLVDELFILPQRLFAVCHNHLHGRTAKFIFANTKRIH